MPDSKSLRIKALQKETAGVRAQRDRLANALRQATSTLGVLTNEFGEKARAVPPNFEDLAIALFALESFTEALNVLAEVGQQKWESRPT